MVYPFLVHLNMFVRTFFNQFGQNIALKLNIKHQDSILFQENETPLYKAVAKGHLEIVRVLLDNAANTEVRNKVS